jgi:hypothetical protein
MGAKNFRSIHDWVRHGMNLHLECENGHCAHFGIADAWSCWTWFRLHRWHDALEAGALRHFRCTRCGARAGRARPTDQAITVLSFFPADEAGWKALQRRLRR